MKKHPTPSTFAARVQQALSGTGLALLFGTLVVSAQAETVVYDRSDWFLAPEGVTSVTVEAWGGGGGGGYDDEASSRDGAAGGGGGGGGYAKRVAIPVTPGRYYLVFVGAGGEGRIPNGTSGGDSFLIGDRFVTVYAQGGAGAKGDSGGAGGGLGLGDAGARFAGGNGGKGATNAGGGGGGAAQLGRAGSAGGAGSGVTGGSGGSVGGGKGGDKGKSGQDGSSPGAGGGGAGRDGAQPGDGSAGRVVIAYTKQTDTVQTGLALDESQGMAGGGVLYRPMPGVINDDGSFSFLAYAKVGSGGVNAANDSILMTNSSGSLRVVAREGDAVAGGYYCAGSFQNVLLTPLGRTIAVDNIRASKNTLGRSAGFASLISPDGISLELIKQSGVALSAGGTVDSAVSNVVTDDADQIYYVFKEAGKPATMDSRLDSETADGSSSVCLVAEGQDVQAVTGNAAWMGQISGQISAGGLSSVFLARLQNNPLDKKQRTVAATNEAVFLGVPEDGLSILARKGDAVPGAGGAKIQTFQAVARSGNGKHAFQVLLSKPALRDTNQALLFEDAGELRVVAQKGVTEVVAGLPLSRLGQFYATNEGAVVFIGWLAGASAVNDGVLCRWTAGSGIELLAREGDVAPSSGRNYGILSRLSVSPGGAILFQATLSGTGRHSAAYRIVGGTLEKLIQTGEETLFEGDPTEVLGLAIYSGGSVSGGGAGESINDAGQAVMALSLGNREHVIRVFE